MQTEALLHVASLGIAGVSGEDIKIKLIEEKNAEWRIPVAIEFLANLHAHSQYRSKLFSENKVCDPPQQRIERIRERAQKTASRRMIKNTEEKEN